MYRQTFIIFTANDRVYCITDSLERANQIIEEDVLTNASVQRVNHITGSTFDKIINNLDQIRNKLTEIENQIV